MKVPYGGLDATLPVLRIRLRGWIRDIAEGTLRRKSIPQFYFVRPDRSFVHDSYFGLDEIRVIYRFLGTAIRPPTAVMRR